MVSVISCRTNFTTFEHLRRSVRQWKLSEQNFENFTLRGRFPKKYKNCSQNFQVLRLQAAVTMQRLQIAGNSLPNVPPTGCLIVNWKMYLDAPTSIWMPSLPWPFTVNLTKLTFDLQNLTRSSVESSELWLFPVSFVVTRSVRRNERMN